MADLYKAPVFHHCLFKAVNCWVVRSDKRQNPRVSFFLLCESRWSRGRIDPWQRPFYDYFWIAACSQALFEFHKALFKCCFRRVVLSNLIASPFMKPLLTHGGMAWVEVCILKGFSRLVVVFLCPGWIRFLIFSLWTPLYRGKLSRSLISRPWILLLSQREKISSIYRLHTIGLVSLCCISFDSISAMKILANDTAILVPMAVPCVWR